MTNIEAIYADGSTLSAQGGTKSKALDNFIIVRNAAENWDAPTVYRVTGNSGKTVETVNVWE
jgi:hypothetical protein